MLDKEIFTLIISVAVHQNVGKTYWTLFRAPMDCPDIGLYIGKDNVLLIHMRGKGSQKEARLERLKEEIVEYIAVVPDCSAADIVHYLSNERRMRNHGLTTRKVGLFIPRYLSDLVGFKLDNSTGKRLYRLAA